jgi:hypothetical protein
MQGSFALAVAALFLALTLPTVAWLEGFKQQVMQSCPQEIMECPK